MQQALAEGHFVAGYATYEAGLALHGLPSHPLPTGEPLLCFGVYREALRHGQSGEHHGSQHSPPTPESQHLNLAPMPTLSREHYARQVEQLQQWIAAGDIYQANYTFPLRSLSDGSPRQIYRELLQQQPATYAAVLRLAPPDLAPPIILSFSPELFFQTGSAGSILTRPMKGTVARSTEPAADAHAAAWLAADPKNRAEHVMIVDLLRNDLGRICQTGSVQTENLFAVQSLPTVHQMVSDVRGQLRPGTSLLQIFRALFPSGSITGAPKLRAMQLLHQAENEPRGVYTGTIGYIAPNGESCFSVAIRTLTLRPSSSQQQVTYGVGGGIVTDSTAPGEYREALLKSAFIRRASKPLEVIETLLSEQGQVRWIETHLDRLQRTAEALGIPLDRLKIRESMLTTAQTLPADRPQRLRLTLRENGELHIRTEPLQAWPDSLRVRLSQRRSHFGDPALLFKTNIREAYDQELDAARQAGFDEALFSNDAGLVTEGCLTNLFFVRDKRIWTAYIECGVLPGILRTQLLRHELIAESLLPLDGLKACEALLLGNSLRGFYPVASLELSPEHTLTWDPQAAEPYLKQLRQIFTTEPT